MSAADAALPEPPRSPDGPRPEDDGAKPAVLSTRIICTMNKLEEEPWLPVRGIVTLFRIKASAQSRPMAWVPWCCVHLQICFERPLLTNGRSPHQVTADDQTWEVQRRYSDFHELNQRLGKAFGEAMLPELPPKLLLNSDEDIAERWKGPSTAGTSALSGPGATPEPPRAQVPGAGRLPAQATADSERRQQLPALGVPGHRQAGRALRRQKLRVRRPNPSRNTKASPEPAPRRSPASRVCAGTTRRRARATATFETTTCKSCCLLSLTC